MAVDITPETILAVLEHKKKRENEIEDALRGCRPAVFSMASVYISGGTLKAYAEFKRVSVDDGKLNWRTDREGTDFDALCDQVLADIKAYKEDMFGSDVERLALAIIRIKHSAGVVTDRALRMDGFTQECITAIHERAAQLANEMSDGKPFEVEFTGPANEVAA